MIVDAHHHLWNLAREERPWMTDAHFAIRRTFGPEDLVPFLEEFGIESTVLVQSACTDSETDFMLELAAAHTWIGAVIGWIDLLPPDRTRRRLDELGKEPRLRGFRHLIHDEHDPHWIVQEPVLTSVSLPEERQLILELPCVFPRHLGDVPELARSFPRLTIVIDHLAKPPLRSDGMARWETELRAAAAHPNVAAKISGLNTLLPMDDWSAADLRFAVGVAVDAFGADRLVCGSDWPMALLNGDYAKVWRETIRVVEAVASADAERLLSGTAVRLYRLDGAV